MLPESGRVSPARQSSSVVLPAPEAPKRMVTPGESAKSTSSVKSRPAPLRRFLIFAESVFEKTDAGGVIVAGSDTVVIERNGQLTVPPRTASPRWARIPRCSLQPRSPPRSAGWRDTSVPDRYGLGSYDFGR